MLSNLLSFTDIAIIDGSNPSTGLRFDDIEVISVFNNSVHSKILNIKEVIPSLPEGFYGLRGTQLPNRDVLLCGIIECLLFKNGSNQVEKLGATKTKILCPFCMLTTRRFHYIRGLKFGYETLRFVGGVKQKIDVLVELYGYAGAIFHNDRMLISGGCYSGHCNGNVS